jgi:hypothetical protein
VNEPLRQLISDTEWSRTYVIGEKQRLFESKFVTEGKQVRFSEFLNLWSRWSDAEKFDFASAFRLKPSMTVQDERIIDYLLSNDDQRIWVIVSRMLTRHSDRGKALHLLENCLFRASEVPKGNFIQALAFLVPDSLPTLQRWMAETTPNADLLGNQTDAAFDLGYCYGVLSRYQPDPQALEEILRHLNLPAQEALLRGRRAAEEDAREVP